MRADAAGRFRDRLFSKILTVYFLYVERAEVDVSETADVYRHGLFAIGVGPAPEALYTARFAEKVRNLLFVESVLCEIIFAGEDRELISWYEGKEKSFPRTM